MLGGILGLGIMQKKMETTIVYWGELMRLWGYSPESKQARNIWCTSKHAALIKAFTWHEGSGCEITCCASNRSLKNPENTIVLITGTRKKGHLVLENPSP